MLTAELCIDMTETIIFDVKRQVGMRTFGILNDMKAFNGHNWSGLLSDLGCKKRYRCIFGLENTFIQKNTIAKFRIES